MDMRHTSGIALQLFFFYFSTSQKIKSTTSTTKTHANEDTLPSVSVRCLTSGGALLLRSSGFGLVLMSFFIFHLRVGSDTAHTH